MLQQLLQAEVQAYIRQKSDQGWNPNYAFDKNPFADIPTALLLEQIQGRARALRKLPLWAATPNIIYPAPLSMEQCSSETTARYKALWLQGGRILDATGGFGVDDFWMAQHAIQVVYCEMQADLAQVVAHNMRVLGATHVETHLGNSTDYLLASPEQFDLIYVDPARRHEVKGKVYRLEDCTPNVLELQHLYLEKSQRVALKLSPLMDISLLLQQLNHVKEIRTITANGELKETLVLIERGYEGEIKYTAAWHHLDQWNELQYNSKDLNPPVRYGFAPTYLYEPHPGLMKLAPWALITARYPVEKWEKNSHLFSSNEWIADFPGRGFKIQAVIPYTKKELAAYGLPTKANITVRNFPETVEAIRKKWKIKDGGEQYLFFTTSPSQEKIVVFCQKHP